MKVVILIGIVIIGAGILGGSNQVEAQQHQHQHGSQMANQPRSYKIGDPIKIECHDKETNQWTGGIKCAETGEDLTLSYGIDQVMTCTWTLSNEKEYQKMKRFVEGTESWSCRIRMLPEIEFYIPLPIPIWGVAEEKHLHIDNHLNFVFHTSHGKILGAAAYPIRDRFQFVALGSSLTVHGPVRWLRGSSYDAFSGASHSISASPV